MFGERVSGIGEGGRVVAGRGRWRRGGEEGVGGYG